MREFYLVFFDMLIYYHDNDVIQKNIELRCLIIFNNNRICHIVYYMY